ncbi:MAG: TetR/AcrR family transcriptional regulator [Candidatus Nanopelagicales bacterium]
MARTRSEKVDEAIVASSLAVIADRGIEGFSVEEVASRASVGKATIYRRYTDRRDLINSALETLNDDLPAINPASTAVDALVDMLEWVRTSKSSGTELLPRIYAQARSNPALFDLCYARVVEPRWDRVRQVIGRGIDSGELRADLDVEIACAILVSPVLMFNLLQGRGELTDRKDFAARLVEQALGGLAPVDSKARRLPRLPLTSRRLRKALASEV